ncbi:hypothetical protein lerEdw1_010695 [Lerista edwardsae]|nr:hypothetical protein lerEdw1_010695 [Lerista edwardsae]
MPRMSARRRPLFSRGQRPFAAEQQTEIQQVKLSPGELGLGHFSLSGRPPFERHQRSPRWKLPEGAGAAARCRGVQRHLRPAASFQARLKCRRNRPEPKEMLEVAGTWQKLRGGSGGV